MIPRLQQLLDSEIDPAFAKRAAFIFQTIERKRPKKILDAGCGRGFYIYCLQYYRFIKEIHGIDVNKQYLAIARKNITDNRVKITNSNVYHLPYNNNYFDLIICSEVLEHLLDDGRALLELRRVLKKNGILIITVPNKNFPFFWDPLNWILMHFFKTHINKNIWWLAGICADHERLYQEKSWINSSIQ